MYRPIIDQVVGFVPPEIAGDCCFNCFECLLLQK